MVMQIVMQIVFVLCLLVPIYAGVRDGLFASIYALSRTFFGFTIAMTLYGPLSRLIAYLFPSLGEHPGPAYLNAIMFPFLFGLVYGVMRELKIKFTLPKVPTYNLVDKIGGPIVALLNGVLIAGLLAIAWSLMPFNKYMPNDSGRIQEDRLFWDAGSTAIRFYAWVCDRMPGRVPFLLRDEKIVEDENGNGFVDAGDKFEDENENGQWDQSELTKYKMRDEFGTRDVEPVIGGG